MKTPSLFKAASLFVLVGAISTLMVSAADVEISSTSIGGTITEFAPGSTISVRSETSASPVRYVVGDAVTYVDEAGAPVQAEIIKSGVPVTVQYVKDGDRLVAKRIVVKKTTTTTTAPVIEERRTTTTTTTTK